MKSLIQLARLSKVFRAQHVETHALHEICLEIKRGEFVCIQGPSGSGKTTLLNVIGLLDRPTSGSYLLEDRDVAQLSVSECARVRNRHIGIVFQHYNLIGHLSVFQNVELPLKIRGGVPSTERAERVGEALNRVGMAHRSSHYPNQLSGGQQQRIALARAIVGEPSIILADEPTGNLDSQHGGQVMELLAGFHQGGATICMVTHDPRMAGFASRQVELHDGMTASVDALARSLGAAEVAL